MSADVAAMVLIIAAAPAATVFPFAYAWIARAVWWRTPAGRALMTSSTALALLVDVSLAYRVFGDEYLLREVVRLSVFGLIAAGAWLTLGALVFEYRKYRRGSE